MRVALVLSAVIAATPVAQASCAVDAMLVFDGSASMARIAENPANPTRIVEARAAVSRVMPQVEEFRRIGLMTYGPGGDTACAGMRIHFPPIPYAAAAVIGAITALEPTGQTPLTASVEIAAELLNYRTEAAIIVVVTDGNETCGGRPCRAASVLARQAAGLTIHVIGFRGEGQVFSWNGSDRPRFARDTSVRCFSDRTGGLFVRTQSEGELVHALRETLGCLLVGRLE